MFEYDHEDYSALFGNVKESVYTNSATCIGQCTGCMCNCKCSCYGGIISEFEWED